MNGILGEIAASASRAGTFPGERHRRLARRRGKRKARAAVAWSILVIIFRLLADRDARFCDLGASRYDDHISRTRKIRSHVRQLEALALTVTLTAPEGAAAEPSRPPSRTPQTRPARHRSGSAAPRPAEVRISGQLKLIMKSGDVVPALLPSPVFSSCVVPALLP